MPQMMPLNWLMLMMLFMILFFMFINLFYFNKNFQPINKINNSLFNTNYLNWSW